MLNLIARAIRGGAARVVIVDPGRPPFYELVDHCAKRKAIADRTDGMVLGGAQALPRRGVGSSRSVARVGHLCETVT